MALVNFIVQLTVRQAVLSNAAGLKFPQDRPCGCRREGGGMDFRQRLAGWFEPAWTARARAELARDPIPGWIGLDAWSGAVFTGALKDQLPPEHALRPGRWRAVGRVDGYDDVLFMARDGRVAWVHMTWQKETDRRWPESAIFASLPEAREGLKDFVARNYPGV